jgi:hypothetical protein
MLFIKPHVNGTSGSSGEHGLKSQGVLHGIASLVVVEVAVDWYTLTAPRGQRTGPAGEDLDVVGALVGITWTVQSNVCEIGCELFR